ncbi:MAG: hypothetical protein HY794_18200 [Desulfarculus sp.]|nr:hypothetical protein [Desulfarculus sp.]
MGHSRVMTGTLVDSATLSASSANGALPVANLQIDLRNKVWQATGCASEYVDIDIGSLRPFTGVAIANHNLTASGIFTLSAGTIPGGSDLYAQAFSAWEPLLGAGEGWSGQYGAGGYLTAADIAKFYAAGSLRLFYFTQTLARYWRLGLADPTNPEGAVRVGRIYLDAYRNSSRGVLPGAENGTQDPSKVVYTPGGQQRRNQRIQYKTARYQFDHTPGAETYAFWFDLMQEVGVGRSFVGDFMPNATNMAQRLRNQIVCFIPEGGLRPITLQRQDMGAVEIEVQEAR